MRKTNVPPVWRAYAQLNRAVRIRPTCGVPVGEGQKRTRTAEEVTGSRLLALRQLFDAVHTVAVRSLTEICAGSSTSTGTGHSMPRSGLSGLKAIPGIPGRHSVS